MRITLVQARVQSDKESNLDHLEQLLATPQSTDVMVLPEMCLSPYDNESFRKNAIEQHDDAFLRLSALARRHRTYLIAGSVPERDNDQLYNTTFVFDPEGAMVAKYRKIHRFAITYPDGTTYDEADVLSAGEDLITVDTPWGTIGLMICFDIRFPMLAMRLRKQGARLFVVPAAFNTTTGPKHWHLTMRSRAVDNQCFLVACAPAVDGAGDYPYYGHSLVVDPDGSVLADLGEDEVVTTVDIEMDVVDEVRRRLPIVARETDL
jgi:predicted amidohydrolase